MKSRYTRGHSTGWPRWRGARGSVWRRRRRMAPPRAGHLHDIGRVGVVLDIWDKPGPLTEIERERVRMHSYFTERILARVDALARRRDRGARPRRLDGSGYHRRLPPSGCRWRPPARGRRRVLRDDRGAADRAAMPADQPRRNRGRTRAPVVWIAAPWTRCWPPRGRPPHPPHTYPAALPIANSGLRLLARGLTNKEIATRSTWRPRPPATTSSTSSGRPASPRARRQRCSRCENALIASEPDQRQAPSSKNRNSSAFICGDLAFVCSRSGTACSDPSRHRRGDGANRILDVQVRLNRLPH